MVRVISSLLALFFLTQSVLAASVARVELNALEPADEKCRAIFLTENKSGADISTLKLDLVFLNTDGVVFERFLGELAPILAAKTVVTNFIVNSPCNKIGSVLVNSVTACAPASALDCLQGLELSSRVNNVRFYK